MISWTTDVQTAIIKAYLDPELVNLSKIYIHMRVYVLGKFLQISIYRNHNDDMVKELIVKLLLSIE